MFKKILVLIILGFTFIIGCTKEENKTNDEDTIISQTVNDVPLYPAKLICYNGENGSGSKCYTSIYDTFKQQTNQSVKIPSVGITCGYPNQVSKISCEFVEHIENKDIYKLTRIFPFETNKQTTITKEVEFEGKKIVVFQDEYQFIVIEGSK